MPDFLFSPGFDPVSLIPLILLGLAIGFISGLFGVGGGFLLVPFLNSFFGVPYNLAVGTTLGQMFFTALSGSVRHIFQKHVDIKMAGLLLTGSLPGLLAGIGIMHSLQNGSIYVVRGRTFTQLDLVMSSLYLVFLLSLGAFMVWETCFRANDPETHHGFSLHILVDLSWRPLVNVPSMGERSLSAWLFVLLGAGVGVLSGLLGVGGGFILMPALVYMMGTTSHYAVGTSLLQTMVVSMVGAILHFSRGNVDPGMVLCLSTGSIAGAQLGAFLSSRVCCGWIRKYFGFLVLFSALVVLLKYV